MENDSKLLEPFDSSSMRGSSERLPAKPPITMENDSFYSSSMRGSSERLPAKPPIIMSMPRTLRYPQFKVWEAFNLVTLERIALKKIKKKEGSLQSEPISTKCEPWHDEGEDKVEYNSATQPIPPSFFANTMEGDSSKFQSYQEALLSFKKIEKTEGSLQSEPISTKCEPWHDEGEDKVEYNSATQPIPPSFANTKEDDSSKNHERFMNALNFFKEIEKTEGYVKSEPVSTESEPWPDKGEDKVVEYDPATQPIPPRCSYVDDLYMYTNAAIQHYNLHQDDHVELVDPLSLKSFRTSDWRVDQIRHLGFIARTKKSPSQLKLFFAEVGAHMVVKICTPVDPGNPLVQIGCAACHPYGVIYHPFVHYDWLSGGGYCRRLCIGEASAKRFFSEAYTIKSTVEDLGLEDAKELEKTINGYALQALLKFNFENDASYQLLKIVSCTRFVCETVPFGGIFWAHLTFVAEVKDRTDTAVHFFAEVGFDADMITTCVIFPTIGDSVSLSAYERCVVCRDVCPVFHPVGRFVAGNYDGTFADSLCKGKFRGVKSELLPKDDAASHTARHEFYESLEH